MSEIRLTEDTLRLMGLFESVTSTNALDCLEHEDKLIFIVNRKKVGIAIGRGGENIKRLRDLCKRPVEIVGYSSDPEMFLRSIFHNGKVKEVALEKRGDKVTALVKVELTDKGRLIGKGGKNLRFAKLLLSRHSEIEDIVIS